MKHIHRIMLAAAAAAGLTMFSSAAHAYSYTYDTETGFSVPYDVVTADALPEPVPVVGEVRETAPDSGVLTLTLQNGNRIEYTFPERKKRWSGGRDGFFVYYNVYDKWKIYSSDGSFLQEALNSSYVPLYYKGRLFYNVPPLFFGADQDTFETRGQYWAGSITHGLDPTYETLYEYSTYSRFGGGYEITPGSFVTANSLSYGYFSGPETDFMRFKSDGSFLYSCDGVRFVSVQCPDTAVKLTHYVVNGVDSIALKCVDGSNITYAAYPTDTLKALWNEYCSSSPYVYLDGVRLGYKIPPAMIDGTAYVTPNFLFETAGAEVKAAEDGSGVSITYMGNTLTLKTGSTAAKMNGRSIALSSPAMVKDGRLMIPLCETARLMGMTAGINADTGEIYIDAPPDGLYRRFSLFPDFTDSQIRVYINGLAAYNTLSCEGNTLVPFGILYNFYDIEEILDDDHDTIGYEMELKNAYDFRRNDLFELYDTEHPQYSRFESAGKTYTVLLPERMLSCDGKLIPVYNVYDPYHGSDKLYVSIEEAADITGSMSYDWNDFSSSLHVYIDSNMVTYDDALRDILDRKGIAHDSSYTGSYFTDIEYMQQYSDNDLSSLVAAGLRSGVIQKSDYPDGKLRPTRTVTHLDLERMLEGIGYNYNYSSGESDKPITRSELDDVLGDL